MSGSVSAAKAKLFGVTPKFVCGGHGARWPADAKFTVPNGIKIFFFVSDGDGLPNSVGQKVDQIANGGVPPPATEIVAGGSPCWDYRLFSSKAGGYLNLAMSSAANSSYITTTDKANGIQLSDIIKKIVAKVPSAEIYWSACRSLESGPEDFSWSKPKYSAALLSLGGP